MQEGTQLDELRIRDYERGRYKVYNRRTKQTYLVDLIANHGTGECDCWDWISRKRKNKLGCKHIRACWERLGQRTAAALAKLWKEGDEYTRQA